MLLPPPSPAPGGIRLSIPIVILAPRPHSLKQLHGGACSEIGRVSWDAWICATDIDARFFRVSKVAHGDRHTIGEIDRCEDGIEQMIAIRSSTNHAQA